MRLLPRLLIAALLALFTALAGAPAGAGRMPNIVFVLADDLGYGDLGAYGQQRIRTPVLDQLAREGMRLTRHYSGNAVCAPSRCVLMTGLHPGHAAVRNNREVQPEGQYPLPEATVTLPRLLKAKGYVTGAFGKWGLGGPGSTGEPLRQGIDRFFGYNCQRVAHNFYPEVLWDDDRRRPLNNPRFPAHDRLREGEDPARPESYARFSGKDYAPDLITREALAFVEANKERPFFLYWPTTVPHLALQVPEESLAEYAGKWEDPPYPGGKSYLPHLRPRAAYAAMVTRMDRDIGRLMAQLRRLGLDRSTLFVFSSDNGPLYDRLGGTDSEFFNSHAGLRGRKGSLYEGGIRVPAIVRWPGVVPAGGSSARVTGFEDWLPTLLELAGAGPAPPGLDGISLAPTLMGRDQPDRAFLYREFPGYGGQQSLHAGRWKAVRQNLGRTPRAAQPATELYDLDADPLESKDVSAANPDVLARLVGLMSEQHRLNPDFPLQAVDRR